ncbi:hypothetical protein BDY19DRAFT_1008582 [Irpex rosettiformis]|uniref:Uncharacterized protein n=1 Tax=Irpex rosettiformis TaxID=378272 RepID=A0ACB8U1S0_9APHY|nr:hypothetical protein BDY19DRAFT_1008582 [Irpex rosettiformis]
MTFRATSLPVELLQKILTLAIELHPCPSQILCVNSTFCDIGSYILYTRLNFNTIRQLSQFAWHKEGVIPYQPRELRISLAGEAAAYNVFLYLGGVLRKCLADRTCSGNFISTTTATAVVNNTHEETSLSSLPLDMLSLRLNSHVNNPNLHDIYEALILANPRQFSWLGPDPSHHFSTAIVPTATHHLFRAISTWAFVETVTLTNIAFPSPSEPHDDRQSPIDNDPLLPLLPRLRCLYLGQATFLSPSTIAMIACQDLDRPHDRSSSCLEEIRLVDAYQESIWSKRLRRTDIEKAALALPLSKIYGADVVLDRIRGLVRCEAMNERIMGGDRSEGLVVLE